jgi:hypothetical protein
MEDNIFTTLASLVLNLTYRGDAGEMAADYNKNHKRSITSAAVKRYCDGGSKYESGPPEDFKQWVLLIIKIRLS